MSKIDHTFWNKAIFDRYTTILVNIFDQHPKLFVDFTQISFKQVALFLASKIDQYCSGVITVFFW